MPRVLNWMHADDETNEAKNAAWKEAAGDLPPHRAWYYSYTFQDERLNAEFLGALRAALWDAGSKSRVVPDLDVKVDYVSALPGVPILRVSMPARFVPAFTVTVDGVEIPFVLYKAKRESVEMDFGSLWGGLRSQAEGSRSATVIGDLSSIMDATDAPPPNVLLRAAEEASRPAAVPEPQVVEPGPPPVLRRPVLRARTSFSRSRSTSAVPSADASEPPARDPSPPPPPNHRFEQVVIPRSAPVDREVPGRPVPRPTIVPDFIPVDSADRTADPRGGRQPMHHDPPPPVASSGRDPWAVFGGRNGSDPERARGVYADYDAMAEMRRDAERSARANRPMPGPRPPVVFLLVVSLAAILVMVLALILSAL